VEWSGAEGRGGDDSHSHHGMGRHGQSDPRRKGEVKVNGDGDGNGGVQGREGGRQEGRKETRGE